MSKLFLRGKEFVRSSLGVDRAIAFTVMARSWSILSGALTVLIIAKFLTPIQQGYYYTFSSIVAMQVVFELGFSFVILQLAAHESSRLSILPTGEISGDPEAHSRLASILQKSVRWYSVAAVLMGSAMSVAGFRFFLTHRQSATHLSWQIPWICLVLAVVFTFQMDPIFSFLEGCGFIAQVARMRLTQALAGTMFAWIALTNHRGLYAPAGVVCGQAIAGFAFLVSKRHLLLPLLRRNPGTSVVGWRNEIWPFQWKMAVSFFCSFFIFPMFNPVLFAYRGATEAGRMGMSLTVASALGTVAFAWINTKASPFGTMISRKDYASLDRIFFRALIQSSTLLLIGEGIVLAALMEIGVHYPNLARRMLPLPIFGLLLLAIFLTHIQFSEAIYLRAHKREPFLILQITVSVASAVTTLLAGKHWGASGITIGYLILGGFVNLACGTIIFLRCRRQWHAALADACL